MTLAPLLQAPAVVQLHAFSAMGAFTLGLVQFALPKGTLPHRTIGWTWVLLMLSIAASSLLIHTIWIWGAIQPDPSALGVYAGDAADCRAARPPP